MPVPDDTVGLGDLEIDESSFYLLDGIDEHLDGTVRAPAAWDTRPHLPPIGDQGSQGSCVGWSSAYYTKTAQEHKELGWAIGSGNTNHLFSPAYIYNQRTNSGSGMTIDNACSLLVAQGCATLATQPYSPSVDRGLRSGATAEAANFRADSFRRFGGFGSLPDSALEEIRAFISGRDYPVIFGVNVYSSFMSYRGGNTLSNVRGGSLLGGHAIAIVGYDNGIGGGSFLMVNSWGPNWGAQGFAWIPYSSMRQIFKYAYAVIDKPNTGAPPPPPNPTDVGNNTIAGAGVIASGETKNGAVGNLQDDPADWWRFSVTAGSRADIALSGVTSDVDVKLATAQDVRLASSTRGGTQSESMSYTFDTAGTYYIKVYPYDNLQSPYSLTLTVLAGETNDQPSGAGVLALNTNTGGFVGGQDTADWWKVTLGANVQVQVSLTGLAADIDVQALDSGVLSGAGTFMGGSFNSGSTSETFAFTSGGAGGTYYIQVYPYLSAQSNYTLRASTGAGVDLRLASWSVNYTNYSDRVDISVVSMVVTNDGSSSSGAYKVLSGLSYGNTPGGTYWYMPSGVRWVSSGLAGGASDTWSTGTETIYKSGITPSGTYYILFFADCDSAVAESDELNNYLYGPSPAVSVP